MDLKIIVEDRTKTLSVPDYVFEEGQDFFAKMNSDMDRGWQMGPEYIEKPDTVQRCQIAADKILIAIDTRNDNLLYLMAGYILSNLPDITGVDIDTHGDPSSTEFIYRPAHN